MYIKFKPGKVSQDVTTLKLEETKPTGLGTDRLCLSNVYLEHRNKLLNFAVVVAF
jgi:hypothetical protein